MKAKLDKIDKQYFLSDVEDNLIATTENSPYQRLSMKNCQSIERGYNLDELANELLYSKYPFHPPNDSGYWLDMYKSGFQKALELMGDKKYTKEDMNNVFRLGRSLKTNILLKKVDYKPSGHVFEEHIESIQQTEWDVEIIEECLDKNCDGVDRKGECITTGKLKLDVDGCLILKKI